MWLETDPVSLVLWFQFLLDIVLLVLLCLIFIRLRRITPQKIDAFIVSLREMDELCKELDANLQEKRALIASLKEELSGLTKPSADAKDPNLLHASKATKAVYVSKSDDKIGQHALHKEKDGVIVSLRNTRTQPVETVQKTTKPDKKANAMQAPASSHSTQNSKAQVISLWQSGSDISDIAKITGLSLGEIELILSLSGNFDKN